MRQASSPCDFAPGLLSSPSEASPLTGRRSILISGALWAAGGAASARQPALRVSGTGSAVGAMALVAAAYNRAFPDRRPLQVLAALGSRGGMRAVAARQLDIALANSGPEQPGAAGPALLRSIEYARTPFVIAVRAGRRPLELSGEQLAALFTPGGRFQDGERARPVMRPGDDVDNQLIGAIAPPVAAALRAALERPGNLNAATDTDAADLIQTTPGAFGGCTLAQIISERRPLEALVIDGRLPTVRALGTGQYPTFKSLFAVWRAEPAPELEAFVDFLRGPAAQALLTELGHLPT